ncbi:acetyl-CoA carboxylase 1 [Pavlovales sp. CCMP2436]|nr:acetyl-CoA carboxylase 1 [Pavlovales sp. CCMP2436]
MIKASEGGGGKGVRKALHKGSIADMYRQVADEVKGSPIFLMRLCQRARHIEIQLVCDAHGNVCVLSGRDCSMQRRFQKIVGARLFEGPPRCVPLKTMAAMERAGQRLAALVGYCNAGTVFLF